MGHTLPRSLHVIAELGIADALGDAPQTAEELAAAAEVHAGALERMLRLLSAHGIFVACEGGYAHNAASRLLRSDHPQSMRPLVRLQGIPAMWQVYAQLDYSLRTGRSAVDKALPNGYWGYFADHAADRSIFDQAMKMKAEGQTAGILAAYDFSGFETIADLGGGQGHLLAAILRSAPKARGIVFDLPEAIARAAPSDRLQFQAGSFFEDALPVCDVYLLAQVIHNWSDDESLRILRAVRRSARPGAKLLLVEWLIPEDGKPHWTMLVDLIMLAQFTGRERTEREFGALLSAAGFRLDRVIGTGLSSFLLEASAA